MGLRKVFLAIVLLLLVSGATIAQHGGKAEPLRIEFKRGASSATMKQSVTSTEEMEYVFAARQGQRVTITLTSVPARATHVELKSADNPDYKFESDGTKWSGVAPFTGDYWVNVTRVSHKRGRASFSLRLEIK